MGVVDVVDLAGEPVVLDTGEPVVPDPRVLARIDAIWTAEKAARGDALFDAPLFDLHVRDGAMLRGAYVPYRYFVAQRRDPELRAQLNITPVGVAGILRVGDGVVLGRRDQASELDAGRWESVPSGGLDDTNRMDDGRVDARAQLLDELGEEVGLDPADITGMRSLGLIHDGRDGVSELAFELTTELDFDAVRAKHAALKTEEYSEVRWFPLREARAFLEEAPGGTTPVTEALLGLIDGTC
tara:strand:- start:9522 stop:10244 length:723 start_codon:yes stop_codon:yes gene_type:complete